MFLSLYFISILGMFHMESMWNPCGMSTHGMDMESIVDFNCRFLFHMAQVRSMSLLDTNEYGWRQGV